MLVFWALDRFSREGALETLLHLRRLSEYGVKYRALTEPFLDSTNGIVAEIMTPLLATLARQERVRLSERTRAGLERARAQGKRLGRPRLVVNSERALKLHKIGKSLAQIAAALNISKTSVHPSAFPWIEQLLNRKLRQRARERRGEFSLAFTQS